MNRMLNRNVAMEQVEDTSKLETLVTTFIHDKFVWFGKMSFSATHQMNDDILFIRFYNLKPKLDIGIHLRASLRSLSLTIEQEFFPALTCGYYGSPHVEALCRKQISTAIFMMQFNIWQL